MSGILFLSHRLPFPPDRGDKIRSHHMLKALAELGPVHVGCLADPAADKAHESELNKVAATSFVAIRNKPLAVAGAEALLRREPISLSAFRHAELAAWVRRTLAQREIDTVYVFSGQMGQYVPAEWQGRLVVDFVDVDSAKFEAYAASGPRPMRWINAREARLLRREEARLAARAERCILVSADEAALMASRLDGSKAAELVAIGNGIDSDAYDPAAVSPHAALAGGGPHLVFTGQMDYPPNLAAVRRAIERLMPRVRSAFPNARFHVVGRAPTPDLRALDGVNGARVWGEVPDVRPFLAAADLVLAPLSLARGVQNKVLEAMAMARPAVLTPGAATGIPGTDGVHFAVGDTDEELAGQALALLADTTAARRMGRAARRLVVDRMSWPAMLATLPAVVRRTAHSEERRHVA